MNKPYSEACDRNRDPILSVLNRVMAQTRTVLEVGSGTGQHAVYFASNLPHLVWKCSDLAENLPGIQRWADEANLPNLIPPVELDVVSTDWKAHEFDAVFAANVVHIMSWHHVRQFIKGAGGSLPDKGLLILYGPFNYLGNYTSESNERFDQWLKDRDVLSGIRDFEDIDELANRQGLTLLGDYEMPANNRVLCWQKS